MSNLIAKRDEIGTVPPAAHAGSHAANGTDPVTPAAIGAAAAAATTAALAGKANAGQAAIADLNLGSVTLLADAAGAVNTILARLRASGLILP